MSQQEQLIVVYQGTCRFCNWCRAFSEKRASKKVDFVFLSFENEDGERVLKDNGVHMDFNNPNTIVVIKESKEVSFKWSASLAIGDRLVFPWKNLAKIARIVPIKWGDCLYDWVARHRNMLCRIVHCRK